MSLTYKAYPFEVVSTMYYYRTWTSWKYYEEGLSIDMGLRSEKVELYPIHTVVFFRHQFALRSARRQRR
jgi:hypothetical protein